mgnify:FL=1
MKRIEKFLKEKKPFAVMQSFETFIGIQNKVYEILFIQDNNFLTLKMSKNEIDLFKENINLFELKKDTKDGRIYEFNSFKNVFIESGFEL